MTYEEAILELQHQTEMLPKEPPEDYNGNIEIWFKDYNTIITARIKAIEALEKQIPKKPKEKHRLGGIDKYVYGYCDSCGEPINYEFQYCPICGQKAEWSCE